MPEEIDGAKIIKRTCPGSFGYVEWESGEEKEIKVLAICNYDDQEECYLFACDEQFNVLGDTLHASINEAMEAALQLYEQEKIEWL
ncbi:hypothetical protein [Paenibacillus sp. 481]|uniref:hypothetical protein n=1 Tax=Paenibacillus sp. 481 TaxID=2835869 RepID=UPI001E636612|nr:hypothetical protein [Paenibacillus sp. 481]UHA73747.1 hypothetical protein KIK04_00810 [Paenibacillus sp. 481]